MIDKVFIRLYGADSEQVSLVEEIFSLLDSNGFDSFYPEELYIDSVKVLYIEPDNAVKGSVLVHWDNTDSDKFCSALILNKDELNSILSITRDCVNEILKKYAF